ncbi:MAG TPA: hypothetical protein VG841_14885 [Caulobacterales bacterium]|nr:hypothetical protein [Caulobacterales bacterium]
MADSVNADREAPAPATAFLSGHTAKNPHEMRPFALRVFPRNAREIALRGKKARKMRVFARWEASAVTFSQDLAGISEPADGEKKSNDEELAAGR